MPSYSVYTPFLNSAGSASLDMYTEWEHSEGPSLLVAGKRANLSPFQGRLQKGHEGDRHGKAGRRHQRSLSMKTRFTPNAGVRIGETKAWRRGEACSSEEYKATSWGERLQKHSLQS